MHLLGTASVLVHHAKSALRRFHALSFHGKYQIQNLNLRVRITHETSADHQSELTGY